MIDTGTIAVLAPFLMVIGIVWVTSHAKLEEKRIAANAARKDSPQDSATLERVEYLEERVRILERIVTDGGYDLARKIEALRDDRGVDFAQQIENQGDEPRLASTHAQREPN